MPRKQKSIFYIYKITCKVTGRYYIGMHSTSNLEDGYFGSGKRLKYSIQKHGLENHSKEILEFLDTKESLVNREIQLVTIDLLNDPMCMNLKPGGSGGLCSTEHMQKFVNAGTKRQVEKLKTDREYRNRIGKQRSEFNKKQWSKSEYRIKMIRVAESQLGKRSHTEESKKQIGQKNSIRQTGSNNSMYGRCWINKNGTSKAIKKEDLKTYLIDNWSKGRK